MRTTESLARDVLRILVWYPFRWLVLCLPPTVGLALIRLLGDVHHRFSSQRRARLADNLKRILPGLPPRETERQAREYLRVHYVNQLAIFLIPKLNRQNLDLLIELEGLEHISEARRQGRGVVLAHGHFGPVQLPLAALAILGYPVLQIGFPDSAGLSAVGRLVSFRLRLRYEGLIPAKIIRPGSDLRPVLKALSGDGVVMTTADFVTGSRRFGRTATLPFFGHQSVFPLGPARLAAKTGAVLLPLFMVPGRHAPYRAVVESALVPPPGRSPAETELFLTRAFLERYQRYVAKMPGWLHQLDGFEPGVNIVADERPAPDPVA